jgi:hypothetical protein
MVQQIINAIIPIAITAIVGILGVVIKSLGDAGVAFIEAKKKELVQKIGVNTYNQNLAFAKAAWNVVDEYFRITPNIEKTFEAKQKMFVDELKKLVPSLTDEEIASLRQIIAGEINKGKDVVVNPAEVAPVVVEAPKDNPNKIVLPEIPQNPIDETKVQ